MEKMKILQITNHFWPCKGGVERSVEDLSIHLKKRGHDVSVLCLNMCGKEKNLLPETEDYHGIEIKRLQFFDLKYYKVATNVMSTVREINPDVIHVHGLGFLTDLILRNRQKHRKPVIVSTHGGIFHTKNVHSLKKIYFQNIVKAHLKNADKIIAVSENDKKLFLTIANEAQLEMIENAIDLKKFKILERKPVKNTFVFVGRISNNKRIDLLIDVFSKLKNKDFKIKIVGKDFDNLRDNLEKKAKDCGLSNKIKFAGEVNEKELIQIFKETEFFVSASEYEGFGISTIEAMASGLIPVLNSIPSFRKFVTAGKNGFIVNFSDTKNTAIQIERILKLSDKEKKELSKNAVKVSKNYSWSNQIKKFEKMYNDVIE
ncbi:MAG: glycosyltransferase family 4 protein [Candidatus Diapherotrites archaeon]